MIDLETFKRRVSTMYGVIIFFAAGCRNRFSILAYICQHVSRDKSENFIDPGAEKGVS